MLKTYLNSLKLNSPFFLIIILLAFTTATYGQNSVAIGSPTVKENAVLWLNGNGNQGLLLPVVANLSNIPISGPDDRGMIVYLTSDEKIYYRNASAWVEIGAGGSAGTTYGLAYDPSTGEVSLVSGGTDLTVLPSLDGDVTGNLNNTEIAIGVVGTTEISNGSIALEDLSPMGLGSTDTGRILQWNGTAWETVVNTGGTSLTAGTGIDITAGVISNTGDADASDDLTNSSSISDLANVSVTSPSTGQVMKYDGTNWVNDTDNSGGTPAVDNVTIELNGSSELRVKDGGITTGKIADNSISGVQLQNNSVDINHINPDAVTGDKIALGAVGSTEVLDGSITDVDINAGAAIAVSKLAGGTNGQVLTTSAGVASWQPAGASALPNTGNREILIGDGGSVNAVTTTGDVEIASDGTTTITNVAATGNSIVNAINTGAGTINAGRLTLPTNHVINTDAPNAAGDISGNFNTGLTIDTDAVTGDKIALGSVGSTEILDGSITDVDISVVAASKASVSAITNLAATNVQGALGELQGDIDGISDTDSQNLVLSGATGSATPAEAFNVDISGGTGVTLTEGTNIEIIRSGTNLTIGSTAAASGEANTASNVGASGIGVFKQKASADLEFKNINAGSNKVIVSNDAGNDEIDIDVDQTNLTLTNTQITGLGTMSTQNANNVNITGGTITGVAINNTVTGDGSGLTGITSTVNTVATKISGNGSVGTPLTITTGAITSTELATGAVSGGTGGIITDNTITNADINSTAAIDVLKLASSGSDGDILQVSGGVPVWSPAGSSNDAQSIRGTNVNAGISPTSGQVLKFDGTDWVAGSDDVGAGGVPTLADGQVLIGDGATNSAAGVQGDLTMSGAANFQIAVNAVTTTEINDGTIIGADISATTNITANSFSGDGSALTGITATVTTDGSSVSGDGSLGAPLTVPTGGITSAKLANSAVTGGVAGVITDNSITGADISTSSDITANSFTGDGSALTGITSTVTTDGATILGDGSAGTPLNVPTGGITTTQIFDGTVSSADIANSTIVNADIAPGAAIDASKIAGLVDNNATNEIQNLSEVLTQGNSAGATAITNLTNPTNPQDAATKNYIDNLAASNNISGSFASGFSIAGDAVGSGNIIDGGILTSDINSPGNDFVLTTATDGTVTWIPKSNLDFISSVSNGLTVTSSDLTLGGTMTQATTFTGAGEDLFFNDFNDVTIQSNIFEIQTPGGDLVASQSGTSFVVGNNSNTVNFRYIDGNEAVGSVLTSNASGVASWQIPTSSPWILNATDVYYNTGNVGIGTATPSDPLTIIGTDAAVSSSGVFAKIQNMVLGTNAVSSGLLLGTYNSNTAGAKGGIFLRRASSFGRGDLLFSLNDIANTSNVDASDPYIKMIIEGGGNVGIGINNPAAKLHVNSGGAAVALRLDNTVSGNTIFDVYNNGTLGSRFQTTTTSTSILSQSTRDINLSTNGSTKLNIDGSTGNTGIGISGDSFRKLYVLGGASQQYAMTARTNYTGTNEAQALNLIVSSGGTGAKFGARAQVLAGASTANIHGYYAQMTSGTGTAYGFYSTGEDQNYFSGDVGIGTDTQIGSAKVTISEATTGFSGMYVNTSSGGEPFYGYSSNGTSTAYTYTDGGDSDKWKLNAGGVRLTVNRSSGDVGVGTQNPIAKLHVEDGAESTYIARFVSGNLSGSDGIVVRAGSATPTTSTFFVLFQDGQNGFTEGHIRANGSGGVQFNTTSDRRLKQNISNIENPLGKVMKLKPRDYEFIVSPENRQSGFIAQELIDIYPQAVSGDPEGDVNTDPMTVDYSKLTPLLTGAIQEQQDLIERQGEEIVKLKEEIAALKFTKNTSSINVTPSEEIKILKAEMAEIKTLLGMKANRGRSGALKE